MTLAIAVIRMSIVQDIVKKIMSNAKSNGFYSQLTTLNSKFIS